MVAVTPFHDSLGVFLVISGIKPKALGTLIAMALLSAVPAAPASPASWVSSDLYYLDNVNPAFRPYLKTPMRLGNGFKAMGDDTLITVKLIGNSASDSGVLYYVDPVTGTNRALFSNKDSLMFGKRISLGKSRRGAPIVFKYVNSSDGASKYTGANISGAYDFDADPLLQGMAINHMPMPVSSQINNLGDRRWAVAGRASRYEVLFGFEDLANTGDNHDFNDIVFVITGVQLDSEIKLASPVITESNRTSSSVEVAFTLSTASQPELRIFYTLDGTLPAFDDAGPLGTSTLVYAGPFTVTGNVLVQAQAWRPSVVDTTVGVTRYLASDLSVHKVEFAAPLPTSMAVTGGVYLDENGDGHIDAARLVLAGATSTVPRSVLLEDPFRAESELELTARDLGLLGKPATVVTARFADRPFAFGTGFAKKPYGILPPGAGAFLPGPVTLADSVGPVVLSVQASPPQNGNPAWMKAVFSEDVHADLASRAFPFAIRRGVHPDPNGRMTVTEVRRIDARTYLWTFALESLYYPVPGDSLRLLDHPAVSDLGGVRSGMSYHVAADGPPAAHRGDIAAIGGSFTVGEILVDPRPVKLPVSLVQVDAAHGGNIICLDCRTGEWHASDALRPPTFPDGPRIAIRTRGPFTFDVSFFDHLGNFVNRARGMVSASMLVGVPKDEDGNMHVALMWYPVSGKGRQVGSGVYIAQGTYQSLSAPGIGRQGEPVRYGPVNTRIAHRFGYVRR